MSSSTVHNVISTLAIPSCTDEQFALKKYSPQGSLQPVDDLPSPGFIGTGDLQSPPGPVPSATTPTSQHSGSPNLRKLCRSPAIARGPTSTESPRLRSSPATHNQLCCGRPELIPPSVLRSSNQPGTVQDVFALTDTPPLRHHRHHRRPHLQQAARDRTSRENQLLDCRKRWAIDRRR